MIQYIVGFLSRHCAWVLGCSILWLRVQPLAAAVPDIKPLLESNTPIEWLAPAQVALWNPLTSSEANARDYALLPRVAGRLGEDLTGAYPVLSRHFGLRLLEWGALFAGQVPWMVLSHEEGHYRVASALNWQPTIAFEAWGGSVTSWHTSREEPDLARKQQLVAVAGVNQGQLNALLLYQDWARNTQARYPDALAYLLSKSNLMLYAARSGASYSANALDDIGAYTRLAAERKRPVSLEHLLVASTLTLALSGNTWAALIGQAQFLGQGTRRIAAPHLDRHGWRLYSPDWYTLLTSEGLLLGGQWVATSPQRVTLGLEVDVQPDGGAWGLQIYDLPLAPWLRLNPFVRTSVFKNGTVGVQGGLEGTLNVIGLFSVLGKIEYTHDDLLAEVTGKANGVHGLLSLGLHL